MKRQHLLKTVANLVVVAAMSLSVLSCGGGGEEGGGSSGPSLEVVIHPPRSVEVQTSDIYLDGVASCDACPPTEEAFGYCPTPQPPQPSAINVTWTNRTTGATGDTWHAITGSCSCLFSACFTSYSHKWGATVPLVLGENVIEVMASGVGAPGTDSIIITHRPGAIEGLTAVPGKGQVTLTWKPVPDATAYNLYWSTSRDVSTATGTLIPGVSSPYTQTGLSDNVPYYYIVTAVISGVESFPSTVVWATPGWIVESVAATTTTTLQQATSIATDGAGKAHIHYSYDEQTETAMLLHNYYVTNVTGAWASVLVARPAYVNADIALDKQNTVHVSFLDFPGLTHAIYASGSWISEVADPSGWCDASLGLDSADKAHIAYYASNFLRYTTNISGSWASAVVGPKGSSGCYGRGTVSLGMDATGAAHIAYAEDYPGYGLKYATNRGGPWTVSVVDPAYISQVSLAVDPNGAVHIVYTDTYLDTDVKYAHNESGTWIIETIDTGYYPSLGLDAAGKAHVSYHNFRYGEHLRYATNSAGAWHVVPIDATGTGPIAMSSSTAIAVDSQGKVHISYFGGGSLKYATNK